MVDKLLIIKSLEDAIIKMWSYYCRNEIKNLLNPLKIKDYEKIW